MPEKGVIQRDSSSADALRPGQTAVASLRAKLPVALATSLAGALAVLVGTVVLTGWALDLAALKSILPGWVSMKPNTALAFILIGIAVLLSRPRSTLPPQPSTAFSRAGRLCGLLAGLIGLLSLAEYIFGWNPGFDQWLFPEPAGTVGTSNPGRMAPETAGCFAWLAVAVWIAGGTRKSRWTSLAPVIIGLLVTTFAVAAMLSYFTPSLGAFGWWGLTIMAVPTAATFAVLGLAVSSTGWQRSALSWSLSKNASLAFVGGVALLIVISLNTSRSVVRLNETNQSVTHTEQVLHTVSTIHAAVAQAQNLTRGYVITGDQRMLESQLSAAADCHEGMGALRQLIADNPRQQQRVTRLETQVKEALQWFQSVIDASRTGMTDATRRQMVSHGQGLMDNLQATFQQIEGEERQLFQQRTREAEGVARHAYLIISAGTLTTLVIFLAALFGLNRAEAKRQRAERALRDSEEQFRTMANSIPQLAWIARADGFIFWYNQRWFEYTGTTPEQMEGWGWQSVHDPGVLPKVMENWTGAIAAGKPFDMEFPLRGAGGRFRSFLTRVEPLKDADGRVVQWFGTNTDVEVLKEAEEALRDANLLLERRVAERTEELARSKQLLDEAGRLARVGGWEIDLEKNVVSWSDMVREIHEVGPEFRPTVEGAINFYAPESIPVITAAVRRAIEEGQPYDLELELISAKGSRLWVRAIGQPYRDRGKVVKIVGVFQDITGPRQIAEELKRNRDHLAAANKELEAFAYSVSHDLRAPLRSIDGFSRIVLEDCAAKLDDDGRDSLNRIRAATQRMAHLIDDLLNLSRITRAELRREAVDLSALARAVAAELQRQEPDRRAALVVADGVVANGDPHLLRVVLENLLGNAWKFAGKRADARIEFGTVQQDGQTNYFVRDNGAGFDAKYAGKLFGAFQRLHSSADFPGTGIGLATVQRIVHRHGGSVRAEGEVNKGATFYFNLGA